MQHKDTELEMKIDRALSKENNPIPCPDDSSINTPKGVKIIFFIIKIFFVLLQIEKPTSTP